MASPLIKYYRQKSFYNGVPIWTLHSLKDENFGEEYQPYTMYMRSLVDRRVPWNSIKASGYRLPIFLDFMAVGFELIPLTTTNVVSLCRSYDSYLTLGEKSFSEIVKKICLVKTSPLISASSSIGYHAPVQGFIQESHSYLTSLIDYAASGLEVASKYDLEMLGALKYVNSNLNVSELSKRNKKQITTQKQGMAFKSTLFPNLPLIKSGADPIDETKYFPLDQIVPLIKSATSYRNSALWSLIAATACRESEADQVIWADIDLVAQEVLIVEPASRQNLSAAYAGISEEEYLKLEWKGRGTEFTFMLEPYKTLFFHYLELYLKFEYKVGSGHRFVFQTKSGAPLYLSDYSKTILKPFQTAARPILDACGLPHVSMGPHSLRHSYIYFMKNFLEHSGGFGLTESELMLLTGHIEIENLRRYAKADKNQVLAKLASAFSTRCQREPLSAIEYHVGFLEKELEVFKAKLAQERGAKEKSRGKGKDKDNSD